MMNKILGISAVAVAGAAVGGWLMLSGDTPTQTAGSTQIQAASTGSAQAQTVEPGTIDTSRVLDMSVGNPDAPVTIVEYSSFTCPHCAAFNQGVYRQIYDSYVEPGTVRIVKREVYFDAFGLWAGMVARCAGPERYFGVVEMLYQTQREWSRPQPAAGQSEAEAVAEALRRIGRRAGMNDEEMNACLADREMATAMMEVYRTNAERDNVRATPTFVINGRTYSNMSFAEFETAIANAQN
jgi:protein-disulfide isomerase